MSEGLEQSGIGNLVRKLERDYISGYVTSSRYVRTSVSEDVNKIYAYLESKHISGEYDSLGREKPFFNIVLAARNIWFRATDLDRKDIKIKPTKSQDTLIAFLATIKLRDWMKRENFGKFLNDWGINMAGFNETVLKFVEKQGKLIPTVVPWNRIICDTIDFDNNPKIELLEMTEAQLRQNKSYDQTMVSNLCNALQIRQTLDRRRKDTKSNYIKLYEVHGVFSQETYKKSKGIKPTEKDKDIYFQQMHVISFVESKNKGEYDDFTLFSGKEDDPYMITALLPEIDGSIALRGSVKTLFEAQWMMNHTVKSIKDQLDLASKLIFQTSDGNFVGQNALSAIETGDILIHQFNAPLTSVANTSHDIQSLQNFGEMWKGIGNEITGISEAMLGKNPPSGEAWRQTATLIQESNSLFEIMTQNKGLYIEEMMRRFILPHIRKDLNNTKQIAGILETNDIQKIDAKYINNIAIKNINTKVKATILGGGTVTPQQQSQMTTQEQQSIQGQMQDQGGTRFFAPSDIPTKTWKVLFVDLEWDVEVDVTGEDGPDKDDLTTLSTVLQTIAGNPRVLLDPNAKLIFNKILTFTGAVSPLELADAQPFITPPTKRLSETMSYRDLPEDIKRQVEQQAGFTPFQMSSPPEINVNLTTLPASNNQNTPTPQDQNLPVPGGGSNGLPIKKILTKK